MSPRRPAADKFVSSLKQRRRPGGIAVHPVLQHLGPGDGSQRLRLNRWIRRRAVANRVGLNTAKQPEPELPTSRRPALVGAAPAVISEAPARLYKRALVVAVDYGECLRPGPLLLALLDRHPSEKSPVTTKTAAGADRAGQRHHSSCQRRCTPSHRTWPTLGRAAPFNAYRHALEPDRESSAANIVKANKAASPERDWIDLRNETAIDGALTRDLFVAIKRLPKDFTLSFSMNSVQPFAHRFSDDLDTIRQAGFEIAVNRPQCAGHWRAAYPITWLD